METKGVKEALHHVHRHQHAHCEGHPHEVPYPNAKECPANCVSLECGHYCVFYEDSSQLTVSEGEGPQTQVGRGVRNGSQHELDRLNQLVNEDVCEVRTVSLVGLRLVLQHHLIGYVLTGSERVFAIRLTVVVVSISLGYLLIWLTLMMVGILLSCCTLSKRNLLELLALLVMYIVVKSLVGMMLHLLLQDQRLREEHHWCAYQRYY